MSAGHSHLEGENWHFKACCHFHLFSFLFFLLWASRFTSTGFAEKRERLPGSNSSFPPWSKRWRDLVEQIS